MLSGRILDRRSDDLHFRIQGRADDDDDDYEIHSNLKTFFFNTQYLQMFSMCHHSIIINPHIHAAVSNVLQVDIDRIVCNLRHPLVYRVTTFAGNGNQLSTPIPVYPPVLPPPCRAV